MVSEDEDILGFYEFGRMWECTFARLGDDLDNAALASSTGLRQDSVVMEVVKSDREEWLKQSGKSGCFVIFPKDAYTEATISTPYVTDNMGKPQEI